MPSAGPARLFTVRRVVSSVLLAVAAVALVVGFTLHDDSPNPKLQPRAVRTVSPDAGTLQLRQTEIYAELDPTYTGSLSVNGVEIPQDQLEVIAGLNRISFTPGAGREIRTLPPGRNCAIVSFALTVGGGDAGRYQWCFNVS